MGAEQWELNTWYLEKQKRRLFDGYHPWGRRRKQWQQLALPVSWHPYIPYPVMGPSPSGNMPKMSVMLMIPLGYGSWLTTLFLVTCLSGEVLGACWEQVLKSPHFSSGSQASHNTSSFLSIPQHREPLRGTSQALSKLKLWLRSHFTPKIHSGKLRINYFGIRETKFNKHHFYASISISVELPSTKSSLIHCHCLI